LVSTIRNRHLLKLWIDGLKLICRTAESDPDYAWTMGGILAGTVGIRRSLEPDMLLKAFIEAIRSSTELPSSPWAHLSSLGRTIELGLWELSTLAELAQDSKWVLNWWKEIAQKQALVLRLGREYARAY